MNPIGKDGGAADLSYIVILFLAGTMRLETQHWKEKRKECSEDLTENVMTPDPHTQDHGIEFECALMKAGRRELNVRVSNITIGLKHNAVDDKGFTYFVQSI